MAERAMGAGGATGPVISKPAFSDGTRAGQRVSRYLEVIKRSAYIK